MSKPINRIKLLADKKTISRLAQVESGEWVRVQKPNMTDRWVWCTYVAGKKTGIRGFLDGDRFVVLGKAKHRKHARTYRRGQPVSEGIMVEV